MREQQSSALARLTSISSAAYHAARQRIQAGPQPFQFRVDTRPQERRRVPLLYLDVNIGAGRGGRIGLHAVRIPLPLLPPLLLLS